MAGKQITQKVIDFEFSRIQMKDEYQHHFFEQKSEMQRFSEWNLNAIIMGLGLSNKNSFSIKWVGFEQNSYLDAFIYCLFKGCRNTEDNQNATFTKLKFHIYQLAARFLKVSDQRYVVETLCSAQYAKQLSHYLNRNRIIYNLFDKLLKGYLDSINCEYQHEMQDLKTFSKFFSFIKFETINQYVGVLHHIGQKFYIINEKNCYFIVEDRQEKLFQLKRIVENEQQSEISIEKNIPFIQNMPNKFQEQEYPKRIFEYAAPKFIANGTMPKKKKQQKKEVEKSKSREKELWQREKQRQRDSGTQRRRVLGLKGGQKKIIEFRTTLNNVKQLKQNPENRNKSHSKEARQMMKTYYRSPQTRVKTGIIYTSEHKREFQARSSQSKSKQKVFDENETQSTQVNKKPQKTLKMPTEGCLKSPGLRSVSSIVNDAFSQRNSSCKQFVRYESPRPFEPTKYMQGIGLTNSVGFNNENGCKKQ